MGEWADRAFDLLKDKEGDEHVRIQHEAQIRNQIVTTAPNRWMELQSRLKEEVEDFSNRRPDYLTISTTYSAVEIRSPKCKVEIKFAQEHPKVTYTVRHRSSATTSTQSLQGTFSFQVKDQTVWFQLEGGRGTQDFDKTGVPLTVDEVMEFLLNKLI